MSFPAVATACALVSIVASGGRAAAGPVQVDDFGPNPGNLEMFAYSPASAGERAPLVLVLHGCTQQAASMSAAGFEPLADELGFHLVLPQQKSANNPVACFNWAGEFGDPANLIRGQGENQSIASMVEKMKADRSIDPARVFIVGFSAGGGMASAMLATWPDLFAGGAIFAGLPYRCATDVAGAFACQNLNLHPERKKSPAQWGDLVRAAFPAFAGPYPRVFILHGTSDSIVHPDASVELIDQWTDVHGIDIEPEIVETIAGHERARHEKDGVLVLESWRVTGMGHAFPIGDDPDHGCGTVAAFFEDRDLCGAFRALSFLGLTGEAGGARPDAGCGTVDAEAGNVDLDFGSDAEQRAAGCAAADGRDGGAFFALVALAAAIFWTGHRRAVCSSVRVPVSFRR